MTIKNVTLKNGKEYRVTVRKHSIDISVKTCRVHHEVSIPTYMTVTGKHVVANVMAALIEADHAEALEMDAAMTAEIENTRPNFAFMTLSEIRECLDAAHAEALEMNEAIEWAKLTPAQKDLHTARVILGVALKSKHDVDDVLTACHIEALEQDEKRTVMIAANNDRAFGVYWRWTDETSCVAAHREWSHLRDEALRMDAEFDDKNDGIIRDNLTPEQRAIQKRREGMDVYGEKFAQQFANDRDEALRMNEGIDLALKIASLLDDCRYGVEGAMHGALIRDGFHEVDYLVEVAARKLAQEGTAEITAHGI